MGENSKIEWTHHTFNPWRGCSKVHAGCANCYAVTDRSVKIHGIKWGPHGTRVALSEAGWKEPLRWNRAAERDGERRRVFCASLADVFEDWQGPILEHKGQRILQCTSCVEPSGFFHRGSVPNDGRTYEHVCGEQFSPLTLGDLRRDLFALIDVTPWLDWMLLTKRPENVRGMWLTRAGESAAGSSVWSYRYNVWLGTSISDQATADTFVPRLLSLRDLAPVLFVSAEPLLGSIDLTRLNNGGGETYNALTAEVTTHRGHKFRVSDLDPLGLAIVGGESGPKARPMHPDWARAIRDQCVETAVPFFFKQWGEWAPSNQIDPRLCGSPTNRYRVHRFGDAELRRYGKQIAGRRLDSVEWNQLPAGTSVSGNREGATDGT